MRLDIVITVTARWYIIRPGDVSVLQAIFAIVLADDYDQRVVAFAKPSMVPAMIGEGEVIWRLTAYNHDKKND